MDKDTIVIGGDISLENTLDGELTLLNEVDGSPGAFYPLYPETYAGATEYTPTAEEQTVECKGLMMPENIVIAPIPQNYGLITWNGSILTVS